MLFCKKNSLILSIIPGLALVMTLSTCKRAPIPETTPLKINAVSFSRASSILVDRELFWWYDSLSSDNILPQVDTVRFYANVFYGAAVGFYHIENGDTTFQTNAVIAPENSAFIFWTPSSDALNLSFKGQNSNGLEVFVLPSEQTGVHNLSLKLLFQADPSNPTNPGGDSVFSATFPVIIQ